MSSFEQDTILRFFEQHKGRPVLAKDAAKSLHIGPDQKRELRHALRELERQGKLKRLSGRRYVFKQDIKYQDGVVKRNAKGFGWLIAREGEGDAFIPPPEMDSLIDGDVVRCRIEDSFKGPVAFVEEIIERTRKTVIGSYERRGKHEMVRASDQILPSPLYLLPSKGGQLPRLTDGMLVEAEITHYPDFRRQIEGRILRVLGRQGHFTTEIEALLADASVEREFPKKVEEEAKKFGKDPIEKEFKGRVDLRSIPLCTIDGETAKDFDDAVCAKKDGTDYVVTVAIADVSHYVAEASLIDGPAFERATSLYYPGKCIPMLPEALSNGLCSLKPHVPRLCMVSEMRFDKTGALKKHKVFEGVMKSQARLTYNQVQAFMDGDKDIAKLIPRPIQTSLKHLLVVSRALRKRRENRGAIDFDAVESIVALDHQGEPVSIHPQERLEAHRVIEDLMIAANEAVAEFLIGKDWPGVFRIHEPPDEQKLSNFFKLAEGVGALKTGQFSAYHKKPSPKTLSQLVKGLANHPAKLALDSLLLRSMMQARYSATNIGHFGLASKSYLHFTSPIRRYPDLVVHRLVRQILRRKKARLSDEERDALLDRLEEIAAHCSDRERKATDLERQIDRLHEVWLMRDKVGFEDDGIVTSCTEFGAFVRLKSQHVEGLVHISKLGEGDVEFDSERLKLTVRRSKFSLALGDSIKVKITGVDVAKRFIDLELVGQGENKAKAKKRR